MSNSFIGSKIAIITKSQCRYVGTIIGIDAQTSSILLGNVKCFGTESRPGNYVTSQIAGTVVPIMQFANSDIEDLRIVSDETTVESPVQQKQQQQQQPTPVVAAPPAPAPPSIHDDPAIVSAVISSSDASHRFPPSNSHDVMHAFHQMNLTDPQSTPLAKPQDFRLDSQSNESKPAWPSAPSKAVGAKDPSQGNKSRFFDHFSSTNSPAFQSSNSQSQRGVGREQDRQQSNGMTFDPRPLARQPFFSNDRAYPQQQQQQRFPNDHLSQQQRFHRHPRSNLPSSQPRYPTSRETFYGNVNDYDDEFDFETSNRNFNKLASEDEYKQQTESSTEPSWQMPSDGHPNAEHAPIYDKKKSFFDSIPSSDASDGLRPPKHRSQHRTTNQDTFGYDTYQQQRPRNRRGGNGNQHRQGNHSNGYYYQQQY